jgi:hypothetical protein
LPPWARALLQLAPFISGYLADLLEHIGEMKDATAPDQNSWRHVQVVYHPTGSTDAADEWIMGFDIANITGGVLDSTWTPADYTAVGTPMITMLNALLAGQHIQCTRKEARFYRRAFNPLSNAQNPFAPSGPPENVASWTGVGTGTGYSPAQVAISVTEKTTYPRHWGRMYIPGVEVGDITGALHIPATRVDAIAQAVHDCYAAWMAAEFFPVVPVTQVLGAPTRGLLTVTEVQVDDVYDVIRRRRAHTTTYRKSLPV